MPRADSTAPLTLSAVKLVRRLLGPGPRRFGPVALVSGAAVLAGCIYIPLGNIPRLSVGSLASGTAQARLTPVIHAGTYRTQAVVNPFTAADIDHLVLKVFVLSDGQETPVQGALQGTALPVVKDIPGSKLADPVVFENLAPRTTYRFRAYAYAKPGTEAANLINDPASGSFVDVGVQNDDRPALASLPVDLLDRLFDGRGTSSIAVNAGKVSNTGFEGIE